MFERNFFSQKSCLYELLVLISPRLLKLYMCAACKMVANCICDIQDIIGFFGNIKVLNKLLQTRPFCFKVPHRPSNEYMFF